MYLVYCSMISFDSKAVLIWKKHLLSDTQKLFENEDDDGRVRWREILISSEAAWLFWSEVASWPIIDLSTYSFVMGVVTAKWTRHFFWSNHSFIFINLITFLLIFLCSAYRVLYILNWVYRFFTENIIRWIRKFCFTIALSPQFDIC